MSDVTGRAWRGLGQLAATMLLCLLLPAWSLRYWQAWVYEALFILSAAFVTRYLARHDQALLERRLAAGPAAEKERSQQLIQGLASLAFLGILVVPGLDRRFGWSRVPVWATLVGDAACLAGFAIIFAAFRANSFAAGTIETATNQRVIDTGPYAVVRHPMYAGALVLLAGTPLALGSLWALLCFALMAGAMVWRLTDEERVLARDLPGYAGYRARIRYRLVPGLW